MIRYATENEDGEQFSTKKYINDTHLAMMESYL